MGTTPISGLRYAELTDPANAKTLSQNLATDLDTLVNARFASSVARDTAIPSPTDGQQIYRTDIDGVEYYRNTVWRAAGGFVFAEATLGAPAATIVISNIPQNARHLMLTLNARSTNAGTSGTDILLTYNSVTSSNYFNMTIALPNGGTTPTGTFPTGQGQMTIGQAPNAGVTTITHGHTYIVIPLYTEAKYHSFFIDSFCGATNTFRKSIGSSNGANAENAITSITLVPVTNNFDTGTTYGLYGL